MRRSDYNNILIILILISLAICWKMVSVYKEVQMYRGDIAYRIAELKEKSAIIRDNPEFLEETKVVEDGEK